MIDFEAWSIHDPHNNEPKSSSDEDSDEEPVSNSLDWRDVHTSVSRQYLHMYRQGILTDCTLLVDGEEIKTHRVVLARASCVFEAMFSHEETVEVKTGLVTIRDLTARAVKLMLEFLYKDTIKLRTMEDTAEVTRAAHMYQISRLLMLCQHFMIKLLSPANIWSTLELANLLNLQAVRQCCIEDIQRKTCRCIHSEDTEFLRASEESIVTLVRLGFIGNWADELTVVNAVIDWARNEAARRGLSQDDKGVRAVIEPQILPQLHLLLLPKKMFRAGSGFAGWLTASERQKILTIGHQKKPKNYSWPKTLSSRAVNRNCYLHGLDHSNRNRFRNKHCVKRNVVTTQDSLKMEDLAVEEWFSARLRCSECNELRDLSVGTTNHYHCLHSSLVFKVKSDCTLFGLECSTRVSTDPDRARKYREAITVYFQCVGSTLTREYVDMPYRLIASLIGEVPYNSTVPIKCEKDMHLVANQWYLMKVCYQEKYLLDPPLPDYPNVTCPRRAVSSSNVKFVFHETPSTERAPSTEPAPSPVPGEHWDSTRKDTVKSLNSGLVRKLYLK